MAQQSIAEALKSSDRRKVMGAITRIGKQGHTELANELFPFLTHPDPDYRSLAIQSLGLFLRHPDARDIAFKMWAQEPDPDSEVREAAIGAWSSYYDGTADRWAMGQLVAVIRDRSLKKSTHRIAYIGLLGVSAVPRSRIKVLGILDRDLVDEIAREHGLD